jgi:hypothetical protein
MKELEWIDTNENTKYEEGMIVQTADGKIYIIGDLLSNLEGKVDDGGCGCCSESYSYNETDETRKIIKYAWLITQENL